MKRTYIYIRTKFVRRGKRLSALLAVAGVLLTLGIGAVSPSFTPKASAATITNKETAINLPSTDGSHYYTCQAKFMSGAAENALVKGAFGTFGKVSIGSTQDIINSLGPSQNGNLGGPLSQSQTDYLVKNWDNFVPYIQFQASAGVQPFNGNPSFSGADATCKQYIMVPVSATEWVTLVGFSALDGNTYDLLDYTTSGSQSSTDITGNMNYNVSTVGQCLSVLGTGCQPSPNGISPKQGSHSFTVAGPVVTSAGSGGTDLGSMSISWLNASQFTIVSAANNQGFDGEVYQKLNWGGTQEQLSYYFLTNVGSNETAQRTTTESTNLLCSDPLPGWLNNHNTKPDNNCDSSSGLNCVPFFAISQPSPNLDVLNLGSDPGFKGLQGNINSLSSSPITYYSYTPTGSNCKYDGSSTKIAEYNDLPGGGESTVWLYYSSKDDEFVTVFTGGSDNETNWIGTYTKTTTNNYNGPGGGCAGQITVSGAIPTTPHVIFPNRVSWALGEGDCGQVSPWGTLSVKAMTVDQNTFDAVQSAIVAGGTTGNNGPKLACDFLSFNPLNWLFCPIIDSAEGIVQGLDNLINNLLVVNTSTSPVSVNIFSSASSNNYRAAWGTFRIFALGMIAIAALFMIISQAAGLEVLDAYTIRKILPRLLVASIAITLSWSLLQFFVQLSNDMGLGVRQMIYAPFSSLNGQLGGGSAFVTTLLGTGAAIAFGWLALLSFVATGVLAVLIAVAVLIFRLILLTFLIITAPLGIACYVMPQTQKAWKLWYDSLFGVLVSFVIISAFIATGRVFSATALNQTASGGPQTIYQIIAIVSYFAPYFLIPLAFRMAGGFLSTVGGFANDRSRGAFDRLKKFRAGRVQKNVQALGEGRRFRGNNVVTSHFNDLTGDIGAFAASQDKMRFLTDRGARQAARTMRHETLAHQFAESAQGKYLQYQDFANQALTFANEEEARARMGAEFGATQAQVEAGIDAARASGGWSQARRITAVQRLYQSGTGFRDIRLATRAVTRVAGDNEELAASLIGAGRGASRNAGRIDMAASSFNTQNNLYHSQLRSGLDNAAGSAEENAMAGEYRRANVESLTSEDAITILRGKNGSLTNMMNAAGATLQELDERARQGDQGAHVARGQLAAAMDAINTFRFYASPQNATTAFNAAESQQAIEALEHIRGVLAADTGIPTSVPNPNVQPQPGQPTPRLELLTPEGRAARAVGSGNPDINNPRGV